MLRVARLVSECPPMQESSVDIRGVDGRQYPGLVMRRSNGCLKRRGYVRSLDQESYVAARNVRKEGATHGVAACYL